MRSALLLCLLLAAPAAAQRDFLTADEVSQLREAQEPNARLTLYAGFARERGLLIESLLAKQKSGRAVEIREALDNYYKIIDAIDAVADGALKKKTDIKAGLAAVAKAEREILPILQRIQENRPADLDRFQFALKQAIETTEDSLSLSEEDLGKRTADVAARDEKEKEQIEGLMQPKDLEAKKAAEKKAAAEAPKRKPPTLKRKGEQ